MTRGGVGKANANEMGQLWGDRDIVSDYTHVR
jgi:hypothetical protein